MKVKMLKLSAGPKGIIRAGDIIDVSAAEGKLLVAAGYAVSLDKPAARSKATAGELKK